MGSQGAIRGTVILTNFEFSSTIIGKVSHLSGGFSGFRGHVISARQIDARTLIAR